MAAKAAQIAKQLPRKLRAGASCDVQLDFEKHKGHKLNTCSVTFMVDDMELKAEETTQHMYTALDIAAVHVRQQVADYLARREIYGVRQRLKRTLKAEWQ
ncbi:MAG: HPF/RaiA family ribosome-associated protein [Candidatus Saccharibacteria bacterium]